MALRYSVVPLRVENDALVLASEAVLDPVSLAALQRKLGQPISYVIVPKGHVTVELRRLHARQGTEPARELLDNALFERRVDPNRASAVWNYYVSRQVLLGDVLQAIGCIDPAALGALLLRHEKTAISLGDFLVREGVLSQESLKDALDVQKRLQVSMTDMLRHAASAPRQPELVMAA